MITKRIEIMDMKHTVNAQITFCYDSSNNKGINK